jgi:hypothetical protein
MEGNSVHKLIEAIKAIKSINDSRPHDAKGNEINDIITDALAMPLRNCDMPYKCKVEMYGAFKDWCKANGYTMEPMLAWTAFDWLLASSKKKGDTGNEEQAQAGSL